MSETPVAPQQFVTLKELAQFLKQPALADGDQADQLQEVLDASIENVESRTGPLVGASPVFRVHASGKNLVLPATHLTEVTEIRDPDGVLVPLEYAELNLLSGIVTLRSTSRRGAYTVTAKTRDGAVSLRLAVKIIASHLWETQRGSAAGASRFVTPNADDGPVRMGFAIPARAAELIAPFTRVNL